MRHRDRSESENKMSGAKEIIDLVECLLPKFDIRTQVLKKEGRTFSFILKNTGNIH